MYVLDTNIIVYFSQKESTVTEKIQRWLGKQIPVYTSTIVEAELLSSAKIAPTDIALIDQLLATFTIIPVDSHIARTAAEFRRTYGTGLLDALIAATAWQYQAPLVTRNVKDFAKIKEITVEKL